MNITGGPDLSLLEVNEAAELIGENVDPEANIIFGADIDEAMGDALRITVIATGFDRTDRSGGAQVLPGYGTPFSAYRPNYGGMGMGAQAPQSQPMQQQPQPMQQPIQQQPQYQSQQPMRQKSRPAGVLFRFLCAAPSDRCGRAGGGSRSPAEAAGAGFWRRRYPPGLFRKTQEQAGRSRAPAQPVKREYNKAPLSRRFLRAVSEFLLGDSPPKPLTKGHALWKPTGKESYSNELSVWAGFGAQPQKSLVVRQVAITPDGDLFA